MKTELERWQQLGNDVMAYGQDLIQAMIILVGGLILIRLLFRYLRPRLKRIIPRESVVSMITHGVSVILLFLVVTAALHHAGMREAVVFRVLALIAIGVVGVIVLFRPLLPSLPFKVGNTVEAGGLLGRVEATTALNTRLRTFDGKTVFIPNRMILNETVVNFHFTPTRQIRIAVTITYDADLIQAKTILTAILARDPRVLDKPAARVFVLNLTEDGVEIAVRPWVKNADYWRTRCDLLEIIKLRLDQEGIPFASPRRRVHLHESALEGAPAGKAPPPQGPEMNPSTPIRKGEPA